MTPLIKRLLLVGFFVVCVLFIGIVVVLALALHDVKKALAPGPTHYYAAPGTSGLSDELALSCARQALAADGYPVRWFSQDRDAPPPDGEPHLNIVKQPDGTKDVGFYGKDDHGQRITVIVMTTYSDHRVECVVSRGK